MRVSVGECSLDPIQYNSNAKEVSLIFVIPMTNGDRVKMFYFADSIWIRTCGPSNCNCLTVESKVSRGLHIAPPTAAVDMIVLFWPGATRRAGICL